MRTTLALAVTATLLATRLYAGHDSHAVPAEKNAAAAAPAASATGRIFVTATPDKLDWQPAPPALPRGAMSALLEGDPKLPGFFAMRVKLPAGYKVPAHFHPVQERLTVIEGTFLLGHGDKFDETALKEYPAGSYLSMPAGMHHFAMSKTDCVIQLNTIGPWSIIYLNPADDPRSQKTQK